MLIEIGYDISLHLPFPTAVVFVLRVHPTRAGDLLRPEDFRTEPVLPVEEYFDRFGNHCGRVNPPAGVIRFLNNAVIRDSGEPDTFAPVAAQLDSELLDFAWQTFGNTSLGWSRVQAICDFVHNHLRFDYLQARATRTALDSFRERVGVCRDFTHLAITLCRCMNIPARYVTGYLGDIGVPPVPDPMDFSAWFEVYLGERWYTFDARHNRRRVGRIVIGRGRDAGDVPITMIFGQHSLVDFRVIAEQTGPGEAKLAT